jgi:CSLREA domain-containing protein
MSASRVVVATLAAVVAALFTAASVGAKTYEVNKRSDHTPNGCKKKDCTLREAVIAANARDGSDRILLGQRKTYNLTIENSIPPGEDEAAEGDLDVTDPVRITHAGKGRAKVDANGIDRVFHLLEGGSTTFKKVVITGGESGPPIGGGGVLSEAADLTLRRSAVNGNRNESMGSYGGGILLVGPDPDLSVVRSSIRDNFSDNDSGGLEASDTGSILIKRSKIVGNDAEQDGGGVYLYSESSMRIVQSTISGNTAADGQGGGVNLFNPLTIDRSTVADNTATAVGGGIAVDSGDAVLSIVNSTVAGNHSDFEGGGIANPQGDVTANAVTVVRNSADAAGGGLTYGTAAPGFEIQNSLVALNSAPFAPDCFADPLDPFDSGGHNLIGDDSDCPGFDATGDFVNSNPKLGRLKNNGGPTQTVALKKGSPAINKADKQAAPKKDQRGVKRGKKRDIGAYERVKKKQGRR